MVAVGASGLLVWGAGGLGTAGPKPALSSPAGSRVMGSGTSAKISEFFFSRFGSRGHFQCEKPLGTVWLVGAVCEQIAVKDGEA